MDLNLDRPYRKNLDVHGVIYIGEDALKMTVKNLSITGLLAELSSEDNSTLDMKTLFNTLLAVETLDLYLPDLRLAGEVDVVRVDMDGEQILLALEFKQVAYDVDHRLCKRRAHRKNITVPGEIVLHGKSCEFTTLNVSVDGLMIQLNQAITVEEGLVTIFKFKRLALAGKAKVIWADYSSETGTLLGLQYVTMKKKPEKTTTTA